MLLKKAAAGAAFALAASAGMVATSAEAQAPLELDLTAVDQLIIAVQDTVQALGADLGEVTEDLGQQPGLHEALELVGYLITDGLIDLVQAIIEAVN